MAQQTASLDLKALRPFLSLLLLRRTATVSRQLSFKSLADDLVELLAIGKESASRKAGRRFLTHDPYQGTIGKSRISVLQYERRSRPIWWPGAPSTSIDAVQELLLAYVRGDFVALHATEPSVYHKVLNSLEASATRGLKSLQRVSGGLLNAAYAVGSKKRLWLTGIHRSTPVKPDSKVISGSNLEDAIDPLGDQTFYATSLRAAPGILGAEDLIVGLTARQSRIWAGLSEDWEDFYETVDALLDHLSAIQAQNLSLDAPIPLLASPVSERVTLEGIYDVDMIEANAVATDMSVDEARRVTAEQWSTYGRFEVVQATGAGATITARLSNRVIGTYNLLVNQDIDGSARCRLTSIGPEGPEGEALRALAQQHHCLSVRFDSGHTVKGEVVTAVRYRDVRFTNWKWVDFTNFAVDREKPWSVGDSPNAELIGTTDSLFCWIQNKWPIGATNRGWLICDDGAGETADFVHLDLEGATPEITLIHAKASHSDKTERRISVSAYELVESQAVKNLRWLARENLADAISKGSQGAMGTAVWYNGQRVVEGRKKVAELVKTVGLGYRRRVVLIQPSLRRARHDEARSNADAKRLVESANANRMRQLDTLLVGIQSICRSLDAELLVVADAL